MPYIFSYFSYPIAHDLPSPAVFKVEVLHEGVRVLGASLVLGREFVSN